MVIEKRLEKPPHFSWNKKVLWFFQVNVTS